MTTKHTPLPWRKKVGVSGADFIAPDGGVVISGVYGEEDADFVERAVNSHDELVAALEAVIDGWDNWADKGRIEGAMEEARAALAKAKGE